MNELLKIVLSLSLSGSLLILVLFLCKPLFKNKISKCWQYYVWLVVIARLLLPFSPETSFVGTLFQEIDQSVIVQTDEASPAGQVILPVPQLENDTAIDGDFTMQGGETPTSTAPSPQKVFTVLLQNLWLVWLVVTLILLMRKMTIYQGFVRYIKAGRAEVSDTAILDRLALIGEQAGVKTPVELYTNSLISSPLLLGFFRPCIVLPTVDIADSDLQYILLHELTHYKRWDMFYKWLVQLTICLHWFNPLAYLMGREVSRACELACDEAVICKLDTKRQRDYGDTLLNAVSAGGDYRDSLASMTLNESKERLKERLEAIMKFKNPSEIVKISTAFLTVAIMFGATFTGAYATIPNPVLSPETVKVTQSNTITAAQADEMALTLTNRIWVWEWVAFFVPYMSDNGVNQIVSASESAEWAGTLDYTTMKPMKFTQAQVDDARKNQFEKVLLTKLDIDAHAQMIMQSNGQWRCVEFMFPYMTDNGIEQVKRIYEEKHGKQSPAVSVDPKTDAGSFDQQENNVKVAQGDTITAAQADEMALTLTNRIWVWEWVAFFVPYMSDNGVNQIVSASESAEWAGTLDYTTMKPMKFTQAQVDDAHKNQSEKVLLTKLDIDAHAQMIMQSNGQWRCVDFMFPYMTDNGIDQVKRIYEEKHGKQSPDVSVSTTTQTGIINIFSSGHQNINKSGSFEAEENQLLTLTIQSDITGGTVDFFLFSPTFKEHRITIGGTDKTEIVTLTAGKWAYNCTGFFESGAVTIKGQLSAAVPNQTASPTNTKITQTNTIQNQNEHWNYLNYIYLDGYMFGIGCKAQDNLQNYSQTIQLTVKDKEYPVAFYEQAKMFAKDDKFIKALQVGIVEAISQDWWKEHSTETFFIVKEVIVGKTADELYGYYYDQNNPMAFQALTSSVKKETIANYITKAYEDNNETAMMFMLSELPDDFVFNADDLARRAISDGRQMMCLLLNRFVSPAVRKKLNETLFGADVMIPPLLPVPDLDEYDEYKKFGLTYHTD